MEAGRALEERVARELGLHASTWLRGSFPAVQSHIFPILGVRAHDYLSSLIILTGMCI